MNKIYKIGETFFRTYHDAFNYRIESMNIHNVNLDEHKDFNQFLDDYHDALQKGYTIIDAQTLASKLDYKA